MITSFNPNFAELQTVKNYATNVAICVTCYLFQTFYWGLKNHNINVDILLSVFPEQ